jgi:Holliday junction resolvase RusA-like endonuclease
VLDAPLASFTVPGIPVGKGRPRFRRVGAHVRTYTPAKTASFEQVIADQARAAIGPVDPYAGAVEVEAYFVLPVPKSWRKADRAAALSGALHPTGKPDLDNLFKATCDAMNGVVYADDAQVVSTTHAKRYGDDPGVIVTVRAV